MVQFLCQHERTAPEVKMQYFAHVILDSAKTLGDAEVLVLAVDPSVPGGSRVVEGFQLDYGQDWEDAQDKLADAGWSVHYDETEVSPGYFVFELSK